MQDVLYLSCTCPVLFILLYFVGRAGKIRLYLPFIRSMNVWVRKKSYFVSTALLLIPLIVIALFYSFEYHFTVLCVGSKVLREQIA